ncbi:MAG: 30S ribosomal protein S16 [Candidatus Pacebacteria bacterium]|nr:30S ribosomal protein S16 [Candidatus Paceibacterota bacterium]
MLKIRLARIGRKNDPSFRVVVTESTRGPKSGKYIEVLGNYNPKMDSVVIDGERAKHWISAGAQVSDTVHNLLVGQGVIEGKKVNVLPKKSPIVKEVEESAEIPAEAAEAPAEGTAPAEEAPAEETSAEKEKSVEEAPAEEEKSE